MSYYPDLSAYYAAAAANPFTAAAAVRLAAASPPMKRARVIVPPPTAPVGSPRTIIAKPPSTPPARKPQGTVCLDDLKTYCTGPDILICGNCREMYRSLADLLQHKRDYCKLRFACKCTHETQQLPRSDEVGSMLLCGLCTESFMTAWMLIEHFQSTHSVDIYKLDSGEEENDKGPSRGSSCSGELARVANNDSDGGTSRTSRETENDDGTDEETGAPPNGPGTS
ncbi:uncharacterized protein LOC119106400 isoform X2 [Pollicipes pollicipes]|uniref:uncharacterized protein LOC119106400 isoform X2 n=1 Tax=Pollicipes pollicipes TaxID=41117 RepID=UPI001885614C|nr:uncharacterized protein LOC119106400 isoform X2 [Pollicipes pollicipes]